MPANTENRRRTTRERRRRLGLFSKAHQLAKLCDLEVAVIVRSSSRNYSYMYQSCESLPIPEEFIDRLKPSPQKWFPKACEPASHMFKEASTSCLRGGSTLVPKASRVIPEPPVFKAWSRKGAGLGIIIP